MTCPPLNGPDSKSGRGMIINNSSRFAIKLAVDSHLFIYKWLIRRFLSGINLRRFDGFRDGF